MAKTETKKKSEAPEAPADVKPRPEFTKDWMADPANRAKVGVYDNN